MKEQIEHLILDLGGVLFDLDYTLTEKAFEQLGFTMEFSRLKQAPIIDDFEEGKVSEEEFFTFFKDHLKENTAAPELLKQAWNKMLLGMKQDKFDLLRYLRSKYQLFLYSNTNETHISAVYDHFKKDHGVIDFSLYFDGLYLSNEMGIRKPKPEGFLHIVAAQGLNPETTLFIDDSPQHAAGAREAGIRGEWLDLEQEDIFQMIRRIGL